MRKATRQQTKQHNMQLVLQTIYKNSGISRADIARTTKLTRPTVSSIVAELIENNFVIEIGQGPSAGGKRPTLLNIAHNAHHLVCIDLGSQVFRGALVNLRGEIIERTTFATNGRQQDEALRLVYQLIDTLLTHSTTPVLGIGLGTPGLIDPEQGIIRQAVNLGWLNLPLRRLLEERYQKSIYIANDSHMAALAEYTYGLGYDSHNLILIKVGQGIGAGIVLGGHPYYGDGFGAGEIGHVVVATDGEQCTCGNFGCLETTTSTRTIMQKTQTLASQQPDSYLAQLPIITWEGIVEAVEADDNVAHEIVTRAGKYLGVAVANLIAAFNIHQIIIAGRVTHLGNSFLAAIRDETKRRVLPSMAAETGIHYSELGENIVILGSSAMILKHELGII